MQSYTLVRGCIFLLILWYYLSLLWVIVSGGFRVVVSTKKKLNAFCPIPLNEKVIIHELIFTYFYQNSLTTHAFPPCNFEKAILLN
jgi:hypothetical protein